VDCAASDETGGITPYAEQSFEHAAAQLAADLRRALVARYGAEIGLEVAADALTYACEHWPRLSRMENPTGYLFRVGQSAARRYRRRPVVMPNPSADQPASDYDPRLPRLLELLPRRQRSAVLLVCVWDWSYPKSAAVLGVSESTLRNHLRRGLASLRSQLGE
jgi:DNA-directed RNA polymerase specialized sigma24 family protein